LQKRYFITIRILFIALLSISCQFLIPGKGRDAPGEVLFKDDFSNPSSGWNQISTESGETDYADGTYRIYVNQPNMDIWSQPNLDLTDVRIEVDTFKVGGERDNRFGIICRAYEIEQFYTFIISSDGYFGIGKIRGNDYQLIGMDALLRSDVIEKGSAINHIRADCIGNVLSLYVNGTKLAQVEDSDLTSGDVGLIAGTYNNVGTDIRFDNFIVYKP
jgi:hypothetical protein